VIEVLEIVVEPRVDEPDTIRLDDEMFEEFRFVVVALVIVAFVKFTPLRLSVPTFKLEIVAEAMVVVESVVVPVTDNVLVALIFPAIVLPFKVVDARVVDPVEIKVVKLAFTILPVWILEVVAFVVEAFRARALIEEVALSVPTLTNPAVRVEITEDTALNRVAKKFVLVELVIVALVELMLVSEILPADKFVTVALVRVALVPIKLVVFVVVELVVEAFRVAKLAVVPKSVPIVAEVKLAIAAKRLDSMFRLVMDEVEIVVVPRVVVAAENVPVTVAFPFKYVLPITCKLSVVEVALAPITTLLEVVDSLTPLLLIVCHSVPAPATPRAVPLKYRLPLRLYSALVVVDGVVDANTATSDRLNFVTEVVASVDEPVLVI
jgi:hypothetical protein